MDNKTTITDEQRQWMKDMYDKGVTFEGKRYSFAQIGVISDALGFGIDPTPFMNPDLTWQQMFEILQGYLEGIDPTPYNNVNISAKEMGDIRTRMVLSTNPNATPYQSNWD
jgi:hypothetical protein